MIAFFCLKCNYFAKPYTGIYNLIKVMFQKYGGISIKNTTIVSNNGGLNFIATRQKYYNQYSDIDRKFAHNIYAKYLSVNEFLRENSLMEIPEFKHSGFRWEDNIIPPDIRELYINQLDSFEHTDILEKISKMAKKDSYLIILLGPPRCGKTRYAKDLLTRWEKSQLGENNVLEYHNKYIETKFKKTLNTRISILLDGNYYCDKQREPIEKIITEYNAMVCYVEINIGIEMAKLFNHIAIDDNHDEKTTLLKYDEYRSFKSKFTKPKKYDLYLVYYPKIELNDFILHHRY